MIMIMVVVTLTSIYHATVSYCAPPPPLSMEVRISERLFPSRYPEVEIARNPPLEFNHRQWASLPTSVLIFLIPTLIQSSSPIYTLSYRRGQVVMEREASIVVLAYIRTYIHTCIYA